MHTKKVPCFPHTVAAQSSSTRFTHSIHHLAVLTTHHSTNAHAQMLHTTTQPRTLITTVLHNGHAPTCCPSVQESSWLMHAGPAAAIGLLLLHTEHAYAPCQWYIGHCSTLKLCSGRDTGTTQTAATPEANAVHVMLLKSQASKAAPQCINSAVQAPTLCAQPHRHCWCTRCSAYTCNEREACWRPHLMLSAHS